MSADYDKQQWQNEQAERDAANAIQREKFRKTRERAAHKYMRKLERLHKTLTENNVITDFEDEFGTSVLERLETFGSAFYDLEKGRPGDALSFAQKTVLSQMNKKVKKLKDDALHARNKPISPDQQKNPNRLGSTNRSVDAADDDFDDGYSRSSYNHSGKDKPKKRSSFKSNYVPRVRNIEDDFIECPAVHDTPKRPRLPQVPTLSQVPTQETPKAKAKILGPNIISFTANRALHNAVHSDAIGVPKTNCPPQKPLETLPPPAASGKGPPKKAADKSLTKKPFLRVVSQ